ncbi:glycosyltransferase [Sphingomonas mollis]|uniref:Glycosyltransferase n=1 Tax=Sphingomonas mollis TaxID=2795726 RepID=A0ABS0XNQ1_9SPHN|nr:glycosyltransferase [Sphingomonas sp. BT553]MBJ6121368.1 glycosyltransferase [Sphingomonas sp. BT553]
MMPNGPPSAADAIVAIDVTDTLVRGLGTGIQRVVRKIAQNAGDFPDVVLVFSDGTDFHKLDTAALNALLSPRPSGELGKLPPSPSRIVKDFVKSGIIRFPSIHVAIQQRTVGRWFTAETEKWRSGSPIRFKHGDKLVLLDTFWNGCGVLPAAARVRSSGAEIITVVHDTIPITHPDQVPADVASSFPYEMRKAFELSDAILATARTNLDVVQKQMGIWQMSRPTDYFHLGADIPRDFRKPTRATDISPNFLVVGTIEPRKGHAIILDAFEKFWENGVDAKLTFVGKIGWIEQDLSQRLSSLATSNNYFTLNTSASDEVLESLYADADAVIVASSIEGFGLPIVESLNRGGTSYRKRNTDIPGNRRSARHLFQDGRCGRSSANAE